MLLLLNTEIIHCFPGTTYVVVAVGAREDGGEVEAQEREYLQEVREGRREGHVQRGRRLIQYLLPTDR